MGIHIIAAVSENGVIGKDGNIPWLNIDEIRKPDMQRFRTLTIHHPVIMGRVTYESIPEKFRPLPERKNIIITNNREFKIPDGVIAAHSLREASQIASDLDKEVYVIGGATIYKAFLPYTGFLHFTYIHRIIEGENLTLFPDYEKSKWQETEREDHTDFSF